MDLKSSLPKVVAVVAAFNEEPRIGAVLGVLTSYPGFGAVIAVSDGSTDRTSEVIKASGATLIALPHNLGKGMAMDVAVQMSGDADIIFFCDADVRGLTHQIIDETLAPVIAGEVDMKIAMRERKIYNVTTILRFSPLLGGERAVRRQLWEMVPAMYKDGFKIETALNFYARKYSNDFTHDVFKGLTQTIKEKKRGIVPGFISRISMFTEVAIAAIHMRIVHWKYE